MSFLDAAAGSRRVLFFGGKGGVGKTTMASATALALARSGRRVLVVSTDPAHNLGHLWRTEVGAGEVQLADGVRGTELDPAAVARDHVRAVAQTVRGLMPEHLHRQVDRYFESTIQAPGTHEAALFDAIAQTIESGLERFDLVIFDTAPTGHTTRLLEMPRIMEMWTDGLLASRERADRFSDAIRGLDGSRRAPDAVDVRNTRIRELLEERKSRFVRVQQRLTDAELTGFVVVTLPERLPVIESIDLYHQLSDSAMAVPAFLINRRIEAEYDRWRSQDQVLQVEELLAAVSCPVVELPQRSGPMTGVTAIEAMAELLTTAQVSGPNVHN